MRYRQSVWAALGAAVCCVANFAPAGESDELAGHLLRDRRLTGGACAVVQCRDTALPQALAKKGAFVVHALYTDRQRAADARSAIGAEVYGAVSADTWTGARLPYASNLLALLVVDDYASVRERGVTLNECLRVVRPLGSVIIREAQDPGSALGKTGFVGAAAVPNAPGWWSATKPWPKEIGEWTHYCHGPDGNPTARDTVVGPSAHTQWVAGPLWLRAHDTDSSVDAMVTARARIFAIVDEAPIGLPGAHSLPDKWFLLARDAFSGVELWRVPIADWGWRAWKETWFLARPGDFPLNLQRRLVADGDSLYVTLGYREPVSKLDAATGRLLRTFDGTERTNEILCLGDRLILSMVRDAGLKVACVDAADGKVRWTTAAAIKGTTKDYLKWREGSNPAVKEPVIDPAANLATDGTVVCCLDGRDVVCLDGANGKERWRAEVADETGEAWLGALIVHDGVVIVATAKTMTVFEADAGTKLWEQAKGPLGHLWYEWKDVFVIVGLVWTYSDKLTAYTHDAPAKKSAKGEAKKAERAAWPEAYLGYDLRTGEVRKTVPVGGIYTAPHHHRCYRNKATSRFILSSRRGTEFVDLIGGAHTVQNWVRGTCHLGMMPANGLLYEPPHPCVCYINEKLNGFQALAPAEPRDREAVATGDPLQKGPAFGQVESLPAASDDWPTFRRDTLRSGATQAALSVSLTEAWRVSAGGNVTPPTVAAGRVFAADADRYRVAALDAQRGGEAWSFRAAGRVDSPPTYHNGLVLFGCADGTVYALRASDGALCWRFRAAPDERFVGAYGRFESAWPAHGSVLVRDGVAYAAAGRSSYLDGGIVLYALDPANGRVIQQKCLGPVASDFAKPGTHFGYGGGPGALNDILQGDGQAIYLRDKAFDQALNSTTGNPARVQPKGGFLDSSYMRRGYWTYGKGNNWAQLIVHDGQRFYAVRMYDSLAMLTPENFFVPGAKGYTVLAQALGDTKPLWSIRVPVRVMAMALAGEHLVLAGPPDVLEKEDPLGAFEGRKGGVLLVIHAASGEKVAELKLQAPPVFNGIAVAAGRLYLTGTDGTVTCFKAK